MAVTKKNKAASSAAYLLTAAASALPLVNGQAAAAEFVAAPDWDIRTTSYREDDLDSSKLAAGSSKRYDVRAVQIAGAVPLDNHQQLNVDFQYETMSGASPWFLTKDVNGNLAQVMSGASISETRIDANVSWQYGETNNGIGVNGGVSTENDYLAINLGTSRWYDIEDTALNLSFGAEVSFDQIEPVRFASDRGRIVKDNKQSGTLYGALAWTLNKFTIWRNGLSLQHDEGYLSDPYKKIVVGTVPERDTRPAERTRVSFTSQVRRWMNWASAALQLDYRYYQDSWDLRSHTLGVGWAQSLGERWQLTPSVRWYSQTQAEFYAPILANARADGFQSSDYRLSPYGARSAGLVVERSFADASLRFGYEHYESAASYSLHDVQVENPGLVSYQLLYLGFQKAF